MRSLTPSTRAHSKESRVSSGTNPSQIRQTKRSQAFSSACAEERPRTAVAQEPFFTAPLPPESGRNADRATAVEEKPPRFRIAITVDRDTLIEWARSWEVGITAIAAQTWSKAGNHLVTSWGLRSSAESWRETLQRPQVSRAPKENGMLSSQSLPRTQDFMASA